MAASNKSIDVGEFFEALDMLEKSKGIPKEYMLERVEAALVSAYKREEDGSSNVRVVLDQEKKDVRVFQQKTVTEEVEADLEKCDENGREKDDVRSGRHTALTCGKHRTDRRQSCASEVDDTQVCERSLAEDNAGDDEDAARDDGTEGVGEYVFEHNSEVGCAERPCGKDVLLVLETVELHTDVTCHSYPSRHDERKQQRRHNADFT